MKFFFAIYLLLSFCWFPIQNEASEMMVYSGDSVISLTIENASHTPLEKLIIIPDRSKVPDWLIVQEVR